MKTKRDVTTPPEVFPEGKSDTELVPNVRLTYSSRQELWGCVYMGLFSKRAEAAAKKMVGLADIVYADVMTPAFKRAMAKLPERYFPKAERISAQISGQFVQLQFSKDRHVPYYMAGGVAVGVYDGGSPIAEMYEAAAKDGKTIKEEIEAFKVKWDQLLDNISTLRRLLEVWPELRPFIPVEWMDKPKALIPVGLIADMNKTISKTVTTAAK